MTGLSEFMAESERPITQKRMVTTEIFLKTVGQSLSSVHDSENSLFHSAITPTAVATVQFESLKLDFIEIGEIVKSKRFSRISLNWIYQKPF